MILTQSVSMSSDRGETLTVEVVDPTKDYIELMKEIFNFDQIKTFLKEKNFKVLMNSSGATGPLC